MVLFGLHDCKAVAMLRLKIFVYQRLAFESCLVADNPGPERYDLRQGIRLLDETIRRMSRNGGMKALVCIMKLLKVVLLNAYATYDARI